MNHVVLLGDSIFDNARYVPGGPPVIRQLQERLPHGWRATLLAVDGSVCRDVSWQLAGLPADGTHLVVSAGGNDALGQTGILHEPAGTVAGALGLLATVREQFRADYRRMLEAVRGVGKPTAVCTVYDSIPGLEREPLTALALFNEVILREAVAARVPVLDLRLICPWAVHYSEHSPIEPSVRGGEQITRAIAELVVGHDFAQNRTIVYG